MKLLDNAAVAGELDCSVRELRRIRRDRPDFPPPLRLRGPRSHPKWEPESIQEFKARLRAEAQAS